MACIDCSGAGRAASALGAAARAAGLLALLAPALGVAPQVDAATLDPSVLPRVQAATFEVVAAKPEPDPLTYAKPLPLKLIPYQKRTDDYHSIGTAFAIGPNRYVTAGHVLLSGLNSLWGPPALRDNKGHVYRIAQIEKFALRKDFVVFSLVDPPGGQKTLPVDTHPKLNQTVYAVGNALGTGVVIRSGLYTSNTPERQAGAWEWMRFSAAVSPGNSGGPLLDRNGKVIGLVLMKSPNENLNYALPIGEVLNAPAHTAIINRRNAYRFRLANTSYPATFKARFELPMSLADFFATFLELRHTQARKVIKALLTQEPNKIFPNGSGSDRVLARVASLSQTPALLRRSSTGNWRPTGRFAHKFPLDDNGYVQLGMPAMGVFSFHLRKPDDVSLRRLYNHPGVLMDMLLKTGFLKRPVGSARIKVTSLGKPVLIQTLTDRWQRRWKQMLWPLAYANAELIVLALPVPDGYAGLFRFAPAARQYAALMTTKAALDFFNVAYGGTLAQWRAYLQHTDLLPEALRHIDIEAVYRKSFTYASPRLAFAFTPAIQKITAASKLVLGLGFLRSDGQVVWGVSDIYISADINDEGHWIEIERHVRPSPELNNKFQSRWKKLARGDHPFDGTAINEDGITHIAGVLPSPARRPAVLYTLFYARQGKQAQKLMKQRLDVLMKHARAAEYPTATGAARHH